MQKNGLTLDRQHLAQTATSGSPIPRVIRAIRFKASAYSLFQINIKHTCTDLQTQVIKYCFTIAFTDVMPTSYNNVFSRMYSRLCATLHIKGSCLRCHANKLHQCVLQSVQETVCNLAHQRKLPKWQMNTERDNWNKTAAYSKVLLSSQVIL